MHPQLEWLPWTYEGIWLDHKDCPSFGRMLIIYNNKTYRSSCNKCSSNQIGQMEFNYDQSIMDA